MTLFPFGKGYFIETSRFFLFPFFLILVDFWGGGVGAGDVAKVAIIHNTV